MDEPRRAEKSLDGRVIALAEHRELDELAQMISNLGGQPLRCPMVAIVDTDDVAQVRSWLEEAVHRGFDDLIFLTGEGIRRLVGFAERWGLRDAFVKSLASARKITRGPKPARALRELSLRPDVPARIPTTDGVIETLQGLELTDHRVGLQLYGDDPNEKLVSFLQARGAHVYAVAPYRYAAAGEERQVVELIRQLAEGKVHALVFTSSPQVDRIWEVACSHGLEEQLRRACQRTVVAAVGPVTAARLRDHGLPVHLEQERHFFMKPLVDRLAAYFPQQKSS
jgi:uroporphyrinogen-III synthase